MRADEWHELSRSPELTIYTRDRSGSALQEIRAVGHFDAPTRILKEILADVEKYAEFMPYMKESRILPQDDQLHYTLLAPPLLAPRDCVIRVHQLTSTDADGNTHYFSTWEPAAKEGPPVRSGVTRVTVNDGSWLLEPVGAGTRATCTFYTDDGGLPAPLANMINRQAAIRVFHALRIRADDRGHRKDHPPIAALTH
ncbi:MAG TPA: SRPBCC family protein [Chthoniobacterales bacterium]